MTTPLIFIGQATPVPKYTQYKYLLPEQARQELMNEIGKLLTSEFTSDKELYEFISNPKNVEISTVTIKIYG